MQKNKQKKTSNIKTEWDLGLLYKNEKDPQIEKDLLLFEKACTSFEKKYRNNDSYLKNKQELLSSLQDFESLRSMKEGDSTYAYFNYRKDLKSDDQYAESMLNKLMERITKSENTILFFTISLSRIPPAEQKDILADKALSYFHYFLSRVFKSAAHKLTEAEERIMGLKYLPSNAMWTQAQEKLLNSQTVLHKGKHLPLPQAMNSIAELPTTERRALHVKIVELLRSISYFAEGELNAIYIDKKINDELRHYPKPYSAALLGHQTSEKTVEALVDAVTKGFPISHRFYKLKAKLLKQAKLGYADRAASTGSTSKKIPFTKQYEMLQGIFGSLDPAFKKILDTYLESGQIDVEPKKGKRGGAYCSGNINMPTFVLLNNVNSSDSLMTFAHEMGHAIHTEMSKIQPPLYQGYSTAVAEVASTFFEQVTFNAVFETLSEKEKIIALHDHLQDDIQTIFRQIACFNFEQELHTTIRAKGSVSKEEIAAMMNKHMKHYLGPVFNLTPNDGYFFVSWMHIRYFFYVYSYAYGQLISRALYERYRTDKRYLEKIKQFLSAGGSKTPEEIFKEIGIDTSKPEFFIEGLKSIESDIKNLEKLIAKK